MDHRSIHRSRHGFTLIELMIVVAILGVLGCIAVGLVAKVIIGTDDDNAGVDADARAFGQSLGLTVRSAVCTKTDTDGDGYLSCTLSVEKGNALEIIPVECARRRLTWASGCRMQKPSLRGGQ